MERRIIIFYRINMTCFSLACMLEKTKVRSSGFLKDIKKLMADLKLVYAAPTEETALNELELFKDKL